MGKIKTITGKVEPYGYIYEIRNKINDKVYIGKTTKKYPSDRKYEHFSALRKQKHHNQHLQNAFKKYGEHFFEFKVLVYVYSPDRLDVLEQEFIWRNHSTDPDHGYNLTSGGDGGSRTRSIYTKMKMNRIARMRGAFIRLRNQHKRVERGYAHELKYNIKIRTKLKINPVSTHINLFPKEQHDRFREDLELSKAEYYQWQWDDNCVYPFSPKTKIVNEGVMFYMDEMGELQ